MDCRVKPGNDGTWVSGKGVDVTVLVTRRESALWRPSDRMRLFDELGQRQNARLLEPRRDDLQADR
jgi:hypothetical protein